ncbi:ArsC family reductase [Erwinia amylovora]|uniref:ArsC family reductase n=1 Tax=Erwinia amylovora TaxID=552 RepID=UPI0002CBB102|nr:ArsC family reductase [Erwinia amylovora]CCP08004.1 Regulatory protein spx [Erwinia amylovora MR1]
MQEEQSQNLLTLYGIKNCDTIKKARRFLETSGMNYQFHDYRVNGLDAELLQGFIDNLGWEALLNTRGTTWRNLDASVRKAVNTPASALALMLAQPAIIKRPLLCAQDGSMLLGFNETTYQSFIMEKS